MKSFVLALLVSVQAFTAYAGTDGHAGDPAVYRGNVSFEVRKKLADGYKIKLERTLKKAVLQAFIAYRFYQKEYDVIINDTAISAMLDKMIKGGVESYLSKEDYKYDIITDGYCKDKDGNPWAATAKMNDVGGTICVSALRLVEIQARPNEVIGLLLHEHAHHYGFEDQKHTLFTAAYVISKRSGAEPRDCHEPYRNTSRLHRTLPYGTVTKVVPVTLTLLQCDTYCGVGPNGKTPEGPVRVLVKLWNGSKETILIQQVAEIRHGRADDIHFFVPPNLSLTEDQVLLVQATTSDSGNFSFGWEIVSEEKELSYTDKYAHFLRQFYRTFLSKRSTEYCDVDWWSAWGSSEQNNLDVPELY